jgi:putative transcriptional regulator
MGTSHITNNIRNLRFAHGEMTQADLAKAVGVTRQTIIAIENNRYSPSLEVAFRIADVFGVPLTDAFMHGQEGSAKSAAGKND